MLRRYESACAANNPGLHLIPIPIMPCFSHHRCALSSTSPNCSADIYVPSKRGLIQNLEGAHSRARCGFQTSQVILTMNCWNDICWKGLLCIGFNHGLIFICFCSANVPCIQPSFLFLIKAAALPSMKTLVLSLETSGPHYRSMIQCTFHVCIYEAWDFCPTEFSIGSMSVWLAEDLAN